MRGRRGTGLATSLTGATSVAKLSASLENAMKIGRATSFGVALATFLFASNWQLHAQATSVVLTNARVQGASFSFEILASDLSGCVVQAAPGLSGSWTDLPMAVQSPFAIRVDQQARFFRVRCGDLLSVNAAGYVASVFPAGYSMIGNPLDRGNNAVAALFPNPPPKTLLYTFDAKHQTWRNANEFEFGAWTQPDETLNIGDGAFLFAPFSFRQVFAGLATKPPAFPQIEGGLNLLSVSTEGFWYHHNQPNPTAVPPQGTIYFNNYAPHVDAPFVGPDGSRLEGSNWVAQLYASSSQSGVFVPVGVPLPFLTGAG